MMSTSQDEIWDAYNLLLLGPDKARIQKLLARYELFKMTLRVPGDIVECGVFKGTGLMFFLKLLELMDAQSLKRVVGFDMFTHFPEPDTEEKQAVLDYVNAANFEGVSVENIQTLVTEAGIPQARCELIAGDIRQTAKDYVAENPGWRISLLHLDLDIEDATYSALEALWPLVTRGGVVIFDEYGVRRWKATQAIDRFFADKDMMIQTLPFARTPGGYAIK